MAITDLFSKRQRRARGEVPDVYCYDQLPEQLRVQVIHIADDALVDAQHDHYRGLCGVLSREIGVISLAKKIGEWAPQSVVLTLLNNRDPRDHFMHYLLFCPDVEGALDCVELLFQLIVSVHDKNDPACWRAAMSADAAIHELNGRFREHGVGYQFESGQIVRVDSGVLHQSAVKPALALLRDPRFAAAEGEFLRAHEHYRAGRYEEAITDALKSFESVLKVICDGRGWTYRDSDQASVLLKTVFEHELVPAYLQSEFSALRAVLQSGVPTVRNREGAHGAGAGPRQIPEHLVSYVLHMTASTLLFLLESEQELVVRGRQLGE